MDRRLFPRFYASMPFEYQVQLHDSDESLSDQAILKNISVSGLCFMSADPPLLKPGDIADFILKFRHSHSNPCINNEIRATGIVRRIEPPLEESPHFGIAIEFITGPVFMPAD